MANKRFGGQGNGHFSKEKTPAKVTDADLSEHADWERINELVNNPNQHRKPSGGRPEQFQPPQQEESQTQEPEQQEEQLDAAALLEAELARELNQVLQGDEPISASVDESIEDILGDLDFSDPMSEPDLQKPISDVQPKSGRKRTFVPEPAGYEEQPMEDYPIPKKSKRKKPRLYALAWVLAVLLVIESAYCVVIFTDWIKPLAAMRSIYIDTAMTTMTHRWLATALIPGDVVQKVVAQSDALKEAQVGVNSQWGDVDKKPKPSGSPSSGFSKDAAASILSDIAQDVGFSNKENKFFEKFYELDEKSTRAYAQSHPEVVANGWDKFYVHEAGLDADGTDIYTKQGDQVLAIDAQNGLMVVRITGSGYRGVLVIGKDASRLKCAPSSQWGAVGEYVGDIAQNNGGLVAMTGSGFGDMPGVAEGSDQAGGAMCSGEVYDGVYGAHYEGGKRIELRTDNRFYIVDSYTDYSDDCTDATEFTPALIVDGVNVAGEDYTYTAMNPRACIGQTKDEAILMLGIEGRKIDSIGCNAVECANILERYGAYQAMNLDGGTSAGIWYEGEYIMRCSNGNLVPEGRRLPNAWVYADAPVPNP